MRLLVGLIPALLVSGCVGELSFASPWAFAGFVPLAALGLWRYQAHRGRAGLWYSRTDDVAGGGRGVRARLLWLPSLLHALGASLLVVAIARPQLARFDERAVEGIDLFVALDMSGSMASVDLSPMEVRAWHQQRRREPPNRFEHAIATLKAFVSERETDRIGMVVFARNAYLQFPLTLDYQTIQTLLDGLRLEMIDPSATAIGNALGVAIRGLLDSDARSRAIVLITDGKQQGGNIAPVEAAALAAEQGIRVYSILVGREGPTLVPTNRVMPNGLRQYAEQNNPVDADLLQRIADQTGGAFYRAENPAELERDFNAIRDELEKTRVIDIASVRPEDAFPRMLGLALLLLGLESVLRWFLLRRFP